MQKTAKVHQTCDNIFASFRKELGYVCSTNQYIEMAVRAFERDYKERTDSNLCGLAHEMGLNITECVEDYRLRISKSYILSIHTVLEKFLMSFRELPGSPTNIISKDRPPEKSYLEWTMDILGSHVADEVKSAYRICNYYRLVRNRIMHSGEMDTEIKEAFSLVKSKNKEELMAPHELQDLTYGDQVLFSKAAFSLASHVFKDSRYSIEVIIKSYEKELQVLAGPFRELRARDRAKNKVRNYIEMRYPKMSEANWEEIVNSLLSVPQ